MEWGDRHVTEGEPPTVLEHDCGEVLHPLTVCAHCREPVTPGTMKALRLDRLSPRS